MKRIIDYWRKSIKQNRENQAYSDACHKIQIRDYVTSEGKIVIALVVDNIFIKRILPENLNQSQQDLQNIRAEYIKKNLINSLKYGNN